MAAMRKESLNLFVNFSWLMIRNYEPAGLDFAKAAETNSCEKH